MSNEELYKLSAPAFKLYCLLSEVAVKMETSASNSELATFLQQGIRSLQEQLNILKKNGFIQMISERNPRVIRLLKPVNIKLIIKEVV